MSYIIAIIEDVQGDISVNFDHVGNKYLVGIYNKTTKEYTHKTFKSRQNAKTIFSSLSNMILDQEYSEQYKRSFLENSVDVEG
jgi:hypothetical protein